MLFSQARHVPAGHLVGRRKLRVQMRAVGTLDLVSPHQTFRWNVAPLNPFSTDEVFPWTTIHPLT
jgi:hypothetical protein